MIYRALSVFLAAAPLFLTGNGLTPHNLSSDQQAAIKVSYSLKEIGKTDLDPQELSKQNLYKMLSPTINSEGNVIYNSKSGGTYFDSTPKQDLGQDYTPRINDAKVFFHSISNNNDLLVSIDRPQTDIDWMLWKNFGKKNQDKDSFDFGTLDPAAVHFLKLNQNALLIGFLDPSGKKHDAKVARMPIFWDAQNGIKKIGSQFSFQGTTRDINQHGALIGIQELQMHKRPFFWSEHFGLKEMNDYVKVFKPTGWTMFDNLVLTDDYIVYGTYWFMNLGEEENEQESHPHFAFRWVPTAKTLVKIDLKGMLISDVNASHTLVGKLGNDAAVRFDGFDPVPLKALIPPHESSSWQLLEATSINDKGQITGFGKKNGELAVFLAEPIKANTDFEKTKDLK